MLRSLVALLAVAHVCGNSPLWFQQPLDHTRPFAGTFLQRYFSDSQYATSDGPLLFFCGNEGDIETFANFSRFVAELAKRLGGLAVYAEHRFYGQSLPFGNSSFSHDHINLLSVEQALADYASLLQHLSTTKSRKVITFGGSYGGMLSSWMRAKYPGLVFASVASSAPVRFNKVGPSFFELVTKAAAAMNAECPQLVQAGFSSVMAEKRWQQLETVFGLCPNQSANRDVLTLWARNAWVTVAMGNYPYASDLFGKGLQAWPLKVACDELSSAAERGKPPIEGLAAAVASYYNSSGLVPCHNITEEYRVCADQTGCGTAKSAWGEAWDIEACTEIVYFTSTNNRTDMFPSRSWDLPELSDYCFKRWGATPNATWFEAWFSAIKNSSRIIFTNGGLDPWRGGGVLSNLSDSLVAVHIPYGAHIYDLAGSHAHDTIGVVAAREQVALLLRKWLSEGPPSSIFI